MKLETYGAFSDIVAAAHYLRRMKQHSCAECRDGYADCRVIDRREYAYKVVRQPRYEWIERRVAAHVEALAMDGIYFPEEAA